MNPALRNSIIFGCLALAPLAISCDPAKASESILAPAGTQADNRFGEVVSEIGNNIWVIYQDTKGQYWFGSDGKGVFRNDGNQITRYSTRDGLPSDRIREIKEDKAGNIYISTLDGISKYDGQTLKRLKVVQDDSAWRLHPDDLWFKGASNTAGPYRYDGTTLYLLKFPKHYLEDQINREFPRSVVSPYSVFSIYKDTKGHMWFGTQNLGACRYDGKTLTWIYERHLSEAENGGTFGIRTIGEDKSGTF
jgi:ligand-binding sensor domain-containing protein